MPKITKRQKEKLLAYLKLLNDEQKVEYLFRCGYEYSFSMKIRDFMFTRIDSVNWKYKYSKFIKMRRRPIFVEDYYSPSSIYLKYISKDVLTEHEVRVNWTEVSNARKFMEINYHVALSFLNGNLTKIFEIN